VSCELVVRSLRAVKGVHYVNSGMSFVSGDVNINKNGASPRWTCRSTVKQEVFQKRLW
jgi:hypothetical protein